ncbi:hypothetical protein AGMMS49545_23590 [Betaproteobacteria bacterium]|nr:hypothetical protein AGMMS49545_23590 [Betaproteobacteria bacterium]GHU47885.1 hypothetical protein AGMMS50289_23730 [Betaproteobacteria bacterium]
MSTQPSNPTRRRFLAYTPTLLVLPLLPETALAFGKKKIREFGEIYDYLKDGKLRTKEAGSQVIVVKNVDFSGERFGGAEWQYFDFVDCSFESNYTIMLKWLTDSTFTNCRFRGIFGLGQTINVRFVHCKVEGESHIGFDWKSRNLVFENCEFTNSNSDPNHIGSVGSAGEIMFIGCKTRNIAWGGNRKLTLKNCTVNNGSLDSASPATFSDKSKMPYSDFLIEDCDLRGGAEISNAQLQSFTLRNSKVGILRTMGSTVLGDVLIEDIKEGHLRLTSSNFCGKLTVRNCSFYHVYDGYSFQCPGIVAVYTLIENITCSSRPANISGAPEKMAEAKRLPKTQNKSLVIRNCKIPDLRIDWAQTEHLRIENCELGEVYIRDGRIGKLEIIGCSLMKLDVSRTQVKEQDVRVREGGKISGHVTVTEGSNIKLMPR